MDLFFYAIWHNSTKHFNILVYTINKCIDALEFHHINPKEKELKLGSGNTMSWKEYKMEAMKCILVCSNCHKEIHSKIVYSTLSF